MGRPSHEPTPVSRRNVEALAGYGVPEVDIAGVIGIDPKTLRKHYREELKYTSGGLRVIEGSLASPSREGILTMGRPAHQPDPVSRRQVEAMAAYGVPEADIARVLCIDPKTLRKHYRDELDTGSIKANSRIAESLFGRPWATVPNPSPPASSGSRREPTGRRPPFRSTSATSVRSRRSSGSSLPRRSATTPVQLRSPARSGSHP